MDQFQSAILFEIDTLFPPPHVAVLDAGQGTQAGAAESGWLAIVMAKDVTSPRHPNANVSTQSASKGMMGW